jgi:hypothetical protein
MNKSPSIAALAKALAAFRAELGPVSKNRTVKVKMKTGGEYSFDYATLDKILDVAVPVMSKHGLSISQMVGTGGLTTILMHESGEYLEDFAALDGISYNNAQELGSAITYVRRYAITTALGISADDDDDGNVNAGNSYEPRERQNGKSNAQQTAQGHGLTGKITEAAEKAYGADKNRRLRDLVEAATKGRTTLVKDLTKPEATYILEGIGAVLAKAETE